MHSSGGKAPNNMCSKSTYFPPNNFKTKQTTTGWPVLCLKVLGRKHQKYPSSLRQKNILFEDYLLPQGIDKNRELEQQGDERS